MQPFHNPSSGRAMLSYRHSFHAGNHADILKHLTLVALLEKMRAKDKPFVFMDTHSGSGLYDLQSDAARKTGEAAQGIALLWERMKGPADAGVLQCYLDVLHSFNTGSRLRRYPGSPAIALSLLREQDRMILMELHNQEIELLRANFQHDARAAIHHRDGFEGALALTPPTPRRGLLLMDPAYEVKTDYEQVVSCCEKLQQRWPQGVIALWYPMLGKARDRSEWLRSRFTQKKFRDVLCLELTAGEQTDDLGMHGSGMIVLNTPWQLDRQMELTLQELTGLLQGNADWQFRVRWLGERSE
jgi:23S rRNA (adenine2030-N6)-methyltransferase